MKNKIEINERPNKKRISRKTLQSEWFCCDSQEVRVKLFSFGVATSIPFRLFAITINGVSDFVTFFFFFLNFSSIVVWTWNWNADTKCKAHSQTNECGDSSKEKQENAKSESHYRVTLNECVSILAICWMFRTFVSVNHFVFCILLSLFFSFCCAFYISNNNQ